MNKTSGKKILLVDDDKDMCESLGDVLRLDSDYDIKYTTNPLKALEILKEEMKGSSISKTIEDVAPEPIVVHVPEVNALLERLAEITGLGEVEIQAFRADLARMKPSERPGFLKEVIEQEEARRAEELAGKEEVIAEPTLDKKLEELPEETEELKQKLLSKGLAPEEIEVILEEAKNLSKADLEALLASLGIDL